MNAHDAIRFTIEASAEVTLALLGDLTDADLLRRPAPGCNHINWQLGHLIRAEHQIISKALPGAMPPLPDGFAERYTPETAQLDDPQSFCSKEELLSVYHQQRAGTLALLAKATADELDTPVAGWTPNLGAAFAGGAGAHWLMHVGQWSVVRRQLGRPPLF